MAYGLPPHQRTLNGMARAYARGRRAKAGDVNPYERWPQRNEWEKGRKDALEARLLKSAHRNVFKERGG